MLKSLAIRNMAVIENVNIDFSSGFNILTGETGAGKSIIIDSVNLLRGERANKGIIRNGEEKARVDAVFEIETNLSKELSDETGLDIGEEVMLTRELSSDGKSVCRIDGTPVTAGILKSVGSHLVNIHGQHDNTSLLQKRTHIGFLDSFGREEISPLKESYMEAHRDYLDVVRKIESIETDERELARRQELLSYEIEEIEMSGIYIGEDEELKARGDILKNAYKIASATSKAYEELYGGETGTPSAYDKLWSALKELEGICSFDESLEEAYSTLNSASDAITETARFIKGYGADVESTSGEIDDIEERLSQIDDLKNKYASTIEDILAKKEEMQRELDAIVHSEEHMAELIARKGKLEEIRGKRAKALTDMRKKYAKELCEGVGGELGALCMPNVVFDTAFKEVPCRGDGADEVEFVICTNAGEGLKPLADIASGGELSRIMLAIKSVLASCDRERLLIFDEVDSGVSGKAAQSIGEKLWKTARFSQVICITHLPQIAAMADSHYLIEKHTENERTKTSVSLLGKDERTEEIARTLGGANITEAALSNARELVRLADEFKGEENGK